MAAGPTITVRTLALALVVLVAFIVLAPTLRAYLAQREQYRALETELAVVGADVEALDAELRRWADPGYVQAQARERLSFVRPGEAAFRVIDPETVLGEESARGRLGGLSEAVDVSPVVPWYLAVWDSVLDAGEPAPAPGDGAAGAPGLQDGAAPG